MSGNFIAENRQQYGFECAYVPSKDLLSSLGHLSALSDSYYDEKSEDLGHTFLFELLILAVNHPDEPYLFLEIAEVYLKLGKFKESAAYAERAIKRSLPYYSSEGNPCVLMTWDNSVLRHESLEDESLLADAFFCLLRSYEELCDWEAYIKWSIPFVNLMGSYKNPCAPTLIYALCQSRRYQKAAHVFKSFGNSVTCSYEYTAASIACALGNNHVDAIKHAYQDCAVFASFASFYFDVFLVEPDYNIVESDSNIVDTQTFIYLFWQRWDALLTEDVKSWLYDVYTDMRQRNVIKMGNS